MGRYSYNWMLIVFGLITARADESYVFMTKQGEDYGRHYFTSYVNAITVNIQACEDARFALSLEPGNFAENAYEVLIDVRKVSLKRGIDGSLEDESRVVEDLLTCNDYRTFWIQYYNQGMPKKIVVGRGETHGQDVLLDFASQDDIDFTSIAMKTPQGDGMFKLCRNDAQRAYLQTPSTYGFDYYWFTETRAKYVTFQIRGTSDAFIILSSDVHELASAYEVIIGGWDNTQSAIRYPPEGIERARVSTPEILSSEYFRTYWIRFDEGHIEVGQGGDVGARHFMEWRDDVITGISAVSLSSGTGHPGEFQVCHYEDDSYIVNTPAGDRHVISIKPARQYFPFRVTGCRGAELEFLNELTDQSRKTYTFEIADTSRFYYFDEDGQRISIQQVSTPGILSCNKAREFWVSFGKTGNTRELRGGEGRVIGQQVFISVIHSPTRSIDGITLQSLNIDDESIFEFNKNVAITSIVKTEGEYNPQQFWSTSFGNDVTNGHIVIKIMASHEAYVELSTYPRVTGTDCYQVVIGANSNVDTLLRKRPFGAVMARVARPTGFLNASRSMYFWVQWLEGTLSVGDGPHVGDSEFISWTDPEPHRINSIGISTGSQSEGTWEFTNSQESTYSIHTVRKDHDSIWLFLSKPVITFKVRTCNEAKIVLAKSPFVYRPSGSAVHVIIGAEFNTKTQIFPDYNNNQSEEASTPSILDCNSMREFWISWEDDTIRVGRGRSYLDEIVSADALFGPLVAAGLSTEEYDGDWEFDKRELKTLHCDTPDDYDYYPCWMDTLIDNSVVFRVQALSDAHLILSEYQGIYTTDAYEVLIGGYNNTRSLIRNQRQGVSMAEAVTLEILSSDEMRPFWISWEGGDIKVGRGHSVGQNQFISWVGASPRSVHRISMSTGFGYNGNWEFDTFTDNMMTVHSTKENNKNQIWMRPKHLHFYFSLRACQDAYLALSTSYLYEMEYELVIDMNGGSTSLISKGGVILEEVPTDFLRCDQTKYFWLTFDDQFIKFGSGMKNGRLTLAYALGPDENIKGIGLSTGEQYVGEWEFDADYVDRVLTETDGNNDNDLVYMIIMDQEYIVFKVQACDDVKVFLSEAPSILNWRTYEITIGTISSIKDGSQDLDVQNTPGILDCNTFKEFWVNWSDGVISIGASPDDDPFLSASVSKMHIIKSAAFNSGPGSIATFEFSGI